MREKSWKYIVTFQTTTAAMAFESLCSRENVPGRLIPVPKEVSSGCGLAWCVPFESADLIDNLIKKENPLYDKASKVWHENYIINSIE